MSRQDILEGTVCSECGVANPKLVALIENGDTCWEPPGHPILCDFCGGEDEGVIDD